MNWTKEIPRWAMTAGSIGWVFVDDEVIPVRIETASRNGPPKGWLLGWDFIASLDEIELWGEEISVPSVPEVY